MILVALVISIIQPVQLSAEYSQDSKSAFWNSQRKGATMHTSMYRPGHWQVAADR